MTQSTNITPESNYIPSGERWEYKLFYNNKQKEIDFFNRLGAEGWELIELQRRQISNDCYIGLFKSKLIAI